jgi:hypothetical protein
VDALLHDDDIVMPETINTAGAANFQFQSVKVEYHPSADRDDDFYPFKTFCGIPVEEDEDYRAVLNLFEQEPPWRPFPTRIDFELAEVMLDSHMSASHIDRTISLFRQALPNPDDSDVFTLTDSSELARMWDIARASRGNGVSLITITRDIERLV